MKSKIIKEIPTIEELKAELDREKYKLKYANVLKNTIYTLITVAAVAVLIATLWLPVLQIYGGSMTPTLRDGEIVFSVKTSDVQQGDIIAFYYNNKILVKRAIASAGDWVDIERDGTVKVNGNVLDEPYVTEKTLGETDLKYPYQVPEGKLFVMGDHRTTSVDSRHSEVGCVAEEQIVGKIVFRVWPIKKIGGL